MIEHELLFLGLLRNSPKHGYQIKKEIKEILTLFAGVDLKSIYYPLKILEGKGLVSKHADKSGNRPQRFVYRLTSNGEMYFDRLLTENLTNFKRPQFSLDLSLFFLQHVKPQDARKRLRMRVLILQRISRGLNRLQVSLRRKSHHLALIVEHNRHMVDAEIAFLNRFVSTLR
jgi:DNA-binding PadR family transcriptional regulator